MYKRCQVLLSDWQMEYLKNTAERYDLSFSEIIRIFLSGGFFYLICMSHPEYRPAVTQKELLGMIKKAANPGTPAEEKHKFIAKAYFEARKAVEYRLKALKKAEIKRKK